MTESELLTKLLTPSNDTVAFSAKMFRRMIEHRGSDHDAEQSMLAAYKFILETTAHDLDLKFQTENPEMEYGWKA